MKIDYDALCFILIWSILAPILILWDLIPALIILTLLLLLMYIAPKKLEVKPQ